MNEDKWEALGNEMIFDVGEHLIWKIAEYDEVVSAPEGYKEIKTDKISYLRKIYIRKFFVNEVPVKATLYKNSITKEVSYYFEGTVLKNDKILRKKVNR